MVVSIVAGAPCQAFRAALSLYWLLHYTHTEQTPMKGRKPPTRPARPQSGNAAWKAARVASRWLPGRPGVRICSALGRRTRKPCGKIAVRGFPVCITHGGIGLKHAQ